MVRNIIITIAYLILIGQFASAQSKKVKSLLESIEGEWSTNTNGEVEYSKVINCASKSKKDLFLIRERYFLDTYKTDKVFEANNKEQGLLIGYCIWENIFTGFSPTEIQISTVNRTIIECKEGKIRVRVLLT